MKMRVQVVVRIRGVVRVHVNGFAGRVHFFLGERLSEAIMGPGGESFGPAMLMHSGNGIRRHSNHIGRKNTGKIRYYRASQNYEKLSSGTKIRDCEIIHLANHTLLVELSRQVS
jgi:hypothetical protein